MRRSSARRPAHVAEHELGTPVEHGPPAPADESALVGPPAPDDESALVGPPAPDDESATAAAPKGRAGARRRSWRSMVPAPLRHSVVIFLLLLALEYVVVPELVGASKHLYLLTHIRLAWVLAGVVCEIAALLSYALLSQSLLPRGGPGLSKIFRIDLAGLAVSHVLPGGSAGSAGIGYRLLTTNGVRGTDAAFAMATQGMGSAVVLNVMLWFSLVISIPIAGFHPIYVVVALVGMLALLAVGALAYSLTHGEAGAIRVVRAIGRRIPILGADRLEALVRQLGDSLRAFANDRDLLRRALRWAALNWLLDAASLWSFVAAFGSFVNPFELFAAYGIANVLAVLPITPGGLGVIDASAPALLVSFGVTRSPATLAVLAWRLVNFWLPIPVGAAAYVSLRVPRGSGLRARRRALHDMASDAAGAGPTAPLPVTRPPAPGGTPDRADEPDAAEAGRPGATPADDGAREPPGASGPGDALPREGTGARAHLADDDRSSRRDDPHPRGGAAAG